MVTLFFPYRAWAVHQGMEDEVEEEVESRNLKLTTRNMGSFTKASRLNGL